MRFERAEASLELGGLDDAEVCPSRLRDRVDGPEPHKGVSAGIGDDVARGHDGVPDDAPDIGDVTREPGLPLRGAGVVGVRVRQGGGPPGSIQAGSNRPPGGDSSTVRVIF